jgi:hypothetical protein
MFLLSISNLLFKDDPRNLATKEKDVFLGRSIYVRIANNKEFIGCANLHLFLFFLFFDLLLLVQKLDNKSWLKYDMLVKTLYTSSSFEGVL